MNPYNFVQSLLWLAITVAAYLFGLLLRQWSGKHPLVNPILLAIVVVASLLLLTGTPYAVYFQATLPLTLLLAPATVALGIPLAKNIRHVRHSWRGVLLGLVAGSLASMVTGVLLVRLLGGSRAVALAMVPKAVTTPIAMSVAGQIGGQPALASALALMGGLTAALTLRIVLSLARVTHGHAVGLAAGSAGSGIGAAQVTVMGEEPAAFAAIGIGLNGLLTALVAPSISTLLN